MNLTLPLFKDLPRENIKLCLKIRKTHASRLKERKVILAISGGPDSTALAIILFYIAPFLNLHVQGLHVDHCLRAASADEAAWVATLCSGLGFPLEICTIDVNKIAATSNRGIEEAGRLARYQALRQCRLERGADLILTAHHVGDLCEDVIMRLIRGTGWPGLGGMKILDHDLFRPLLYEDPLDLRNFLSRMNIQWLTDPSNFSSKFLRNRIRHNVMPLLTTENPSIPTNFSNINYLSSIDENFWQAYLDNALQSCPWIVQDTPECYSIILSAPLLKILHPSGRLRLFHKALAQLKNILGRGQARMSTLLRLEEAYANMRGRKIFQFPGNLRAEIKKGEITFYGKKDKHG